jgi:glyoxylase-like metal-dependent hydrolase (beta-lactamase superfamily II)
MHAREVVPGLYQLPLGSVNVFLLRSGDGLALIDTGPPGCAGDVLAEVEALGFTPSDVHDIVATHAHYDHTGSLAALEDATGARAWMHPLDAALVRQGQTMRPYRVAPGLLSRVLYWLFVRGNDDAVEPPEVSHEVEGGDVIPVAGGLEVLHAPGHCAGQIALRWPEHGGVLFAADAAAHAFGLRLSLIYENLNEGRRTLRTLAQQPFEVAVFGHGDPITTDAASRFRKAFG